jgi:CelD/BcsL family acetyltransferase involved in cellulose biosynthesis
MGQVILAADNARSRDRRTGWTITIVSDPSELAWRWEAVEAAGASTAFQSREWLDALYTAIRQTGAKPLLAAADDGTGAFALILPLALSRQNGQLCIGFADLGVSDYNAPILGPAAPQGPAEMYALWGALKRALPVADLAVFEKMPRLIAGRHNPLLWLGDGLSSQTQSACRLAEPWHLARQRLMPREFRESLDRRRSKLTRKASVTFRLAETREEAGALFDALVAQKAARSGPMGWHDILAEKPWHAFYRRLALQGVAGGMARIMALIVDGEPASVILGLERHGRFYDILTSFDPTKWKRHSPGLLALDDAMGLMASRGVEIYDLTIGAEGYKDDFGPDAEPLHEYAEALSWRGMAEAMKIRAKAALRRSPRLAQFARNVAYSSRATTIGATHLATNGPVGVVGTAAGL